MFCKYKVVYICADSIDIGINLYFVAALSNLLEEETFMKSPKKSTNQTYINKHVINIV